MRWLETKFGGLCLSAGVLAVALHAASPALANGGNGGPGDTSDGGFGASGFNGTGTGGGGGGNGGGGTFTADGVAPSRDQVTAGIGLGARLGNRLALDADYRAVLPTGNLIEHTLSASLHYGF